MTWLYYFCFFFQRICFNEISNIPSCLVPFCHISEELMISRCLVYQTITKMWKNFSKSILREEVFMSASLLAHPITVHLSDTASIKCEGKKLLKLRTRIYFEMSFCLLKSILAKNSTLLILKNKILIVQWQHRMEFIGTF